MSDLLIKGMEMPKHSGKRETPELHSIVLKVYTDGQVEASKKGSYDKHEVILVSTPHGRLIDSDRAITDIKSVCRSPRCDEDCLNCVYREGGLITFLNMRDTVIEREEV